MTEKMLMTQALDERDLLVKKINDKIDKAISPLTFQELFFKHYVVEQIKDY